MLDTTDVMLGAGGGVGGVTGAGEGALLTDEGGEDEDSPPELLFIIGGTGVDDKGPPIVSLPPPDKPLVLLFTLLDCSVLFETPFSAPV